MECRSLPFLAFLSVMVVVIHASQPDEDYWKLALPHTPMPKAIRDLLQSKGLSSVDASTASCTVHIHFDKFSQPAGEEAQVDDSKIGNFFLETDMIPLVGVDGSKSKAMAACHSDTSAWHPQHVAFQVLKIKPGTVPVCHFLHNNAMVWIPKYIKEGSTVSVMGVVQRNENVLMIVPPPEPFPTGCQWAKCILPASLEGIVLRCEDTSKIDVIPV